MEQLHDQSNRRDDG
jgi:hypothetical protein